jgi:hypothetical protein
MSITFSEDLEIGLKIEDLVLERIQKKYPCATRIQGSFKEYDIWIPEVAKSVEVKYDPMSNETGNIVVEIYFHGKRSALLTTKADYWVFYDDKDFMFITPDELKNLILINTPPLRKFVGAGDTEPKKAYLVKKEILKKYAI